MQNWRGYSTKKKLTRMASLLAYFWMIVGLQFLLFGSLTNTIWAIVMGTIMFLVVILPLGIWMTLDFIRYVLTDDDPSWI